MIIIRYLLTNIIVILSQEVIISMLNVDTYNSAQEIMQIYLK